MKLPEATESLRLSRACAAWPLALAVLLAGGCDGSSGSDGGTTPPRDSGGGVSRMCSGQPPADLGHCQIAGGGECMGATGEASEFAGLPDGATVNMVIGPQGSTMIVFSMRAPGIDMGSSRSDWPLVELVLLDASDGRQLALYRSRDEFMAGASGDPEALEIWVVVDDLAGELGGRSVIAVATVRDRNGQELCGSANVTVGS